MGINRSKFIATSTSLLKALQNLDDSQEDVTFTVKPDRIIGLGKQNQYFANDIQGEGTYAYSMDSIRKLMKCLESLEEQPVVIMFDMWIWLSDIMF
jgi:hypothetical protein